MQDDRLIEHWNCWVFWGISVSSSETSGVFEKYGSRVSKFHAIVLYPFLVSGNGLLSVWLSAPCSESC